MPAGGMQFESDSDIWNEDCQRIQRQPPRMKIRVYVKGELLDSASVIDHPFIRGM